MPRRSFFRGFPGFRLSPPFSQSENGYAALPIPAATLFANEKKPVIFMEKLTEFLKILTDFFKILTENFCTFHCGLQRHSFFLLYLLSEKWFLFNKRRWGFFPDEAKQHTLWIEWWKKNITIFLMSVVANIEKILGFLIGRNLFGE